MNKKIKVGMDISQLAHTGGVATYTDNLTKRLSKRSELGMVYFYSSLRKKYRGDLKNVKSYRLPPTLFEVLFNKIRNVPIEKFIGGIDIFHSSDWTQPPSRAKKVTTIHDLVPLKFPQWSHPKIVEVHKKRLALVEKEIDFVIVVSETTKKDLLEVSKIPEEKVKVICEGPSADFKKPTDAELNIFKKKYNLPDRFILTIGGVGERKNLDRIKEASINYNLVISGQTIPWLDIEELGLLYYSASALVYASLYEGFGLPIVDAFKCGLPVITSNISSMLEIAGSSAVLVNPYNITEIKDSIEDVMEDKGFRKELIKKGQERSKFFSWDKCTDETVKVYENLMKGI